MRPRTGSSSCCTRGGEVVLIAVASGKGAPGASSTALALTLTWPRPVLLVECDPRGGDLLWGFGQGRFAAGRGLLNLWVAARGAASMSDALWSATVELGENRWALSGLDESRQSGSVAWSVLARALTQVPDGIDVIADCGVAPALRAPSAVWSAADLVVLATRSSLRATHSAINAGTLLRAELTSSGFGPDRLGAVVIGAGRPYPMGQVRAALESTAPVLGELPWAPAAAATLSDGVAAGREYRKLMTASQSLAATLLEAVASRCAGAGVPAPQGGLSGHRSPLQDPAGWPASPPPPESAAVPMAAQSFQDSVRWPGGPSASPAGSSSWAPPVDIDGGRHG